MGRLAAVLVVGVLVVGACSGDDDDKDDPAGRAETTTTAEETTTTEAASAAAAAADLCAGAQASAPPATVAQAALTEISGLAASSANDGVIWAHNDSGGMPEVFAIGSDGSDLGRFPLQDAAALDWEDMALAEDTLFLGDIGDNFKLRPAVTVYRVAEPDLADGAAGTVLDEVEKLEVSYADGPRDAETLLADPVTGDLFVVSKFDSPAGLYRIPADTRTGATVPMERVADVPLLSSQATATGGEISADGSLIALRTYHDVLLWQRAPGQSVAEAMAGEPCVAPQAEEIQGEALAIAADGQGYLTVSEGVNQPINVFRLP